MLVARAIHVVTHVGRSNVLEGEDTCRCHIMRGSMEMATAVAQLCRGDVGAGHPLVVAQNSRVSECGIPERSQHKIAVGFLKSVKFTGNMQYENTRKGADWAVAGCSTGLYVKNPRLLSHNAATGALMVAAKRWLLNLWARCRCVHRRSNRC